MIIHKNRRLLTTVPVFAWVLFDIIEQKHRKAGKTK